jgi:hypothetical protein
VLLEGYFGIQFYLKDSLARPVDLITEKEQAALLRQILIHLLKLQLSRSRERYPLRSARQWCHPQPSPA